MSVETKPWDAAEYLSDEEDLADYLLLTLEEGPANLFAKALATAARARGGVRTLAAETAVPEQDILHAMEANDVGSRDVLAQVQRAYQRRSAKSLAA